MKQAIMFTIFFILYFTGNTYADVKVKVATIDGKISCNNTDGCKFQTQQKADSWIAKHIANDSWGKPERWERYTDQTNCLEIVDVEFFGEVEYQNCKLPVEYTIEITDITAEVEAEEVKKAVDKLRIDELKVKDKNNMKLDELVEILKLKGII